MTVWPSRPDLGIPSLRFGTKMLPGEGMTSLCSAASCILSSCSILFLVLSFLCFYSFLFLPESSSLRVRREDTTGRNLDDKSTRDPSKSCADIHA